MMDINPEKVAIAFQSSRDKMRGRRLNMAFMTLIIVLVIYTVVPMYFYSDSIKASPAIAQIAQNLKPEDKKLFEKLDDIEAKVADQISLLKSLQSQTGYKEEDVAELHSQIASGKALIAKLQKTIRDNEEAKAQKKDDDKPGVYKKIFHQLPPTSIWCYGEKRIDRVCRFKNLYYNPEFKAWFAVITENSILHNIPVDRSPALIDLTTIEDHSVFYFDYEEVVPSKFTDVMVTYVEKRTFMFSRFHIGNIMHSLHDDIIGLYHVIKRFAPADTTGGKPDFAAFSTDHYLQTYDEHGEGAYGHLFKLLSDHPVRWREDLMKDSAITMFEDIIVGNSKIANWYQYGFGSPQGPIKNKNVYGYHIRQVAEYIKWKLGLHDSQSFDFTGEKPELDTLVVFSRKDNRLIVNENELLAGLSKEFGLKGQLLRMEDHPFKEQVAILKKTKVAIGMHGSMLVMAMFMAPGSILIELYPFAVPSENYTPYRTLANLPGINIMYKAWENKHENNNIMHPEYSMYQGGIRHLPEAEQKKIIDTKTVPPHICCMDPYWLFRIYQDTIVDLDELKNLIKQAKKESEDKMLAKLAVVPILTPSRIDAKSVACKATVDGEKVKAVEISWAEPWNGVKCDEYSIWEHYQYKEFTTKTNKLVMDTSTRFKKGDNIEFWIRPVKNGIKGRYSDKITCNVWTGEVTLPQ